VLIVDRFGNIQLNLTTEDLSSVGVEPGTQVEVEIGLQRFYACAASTFADVRIGDIVLYEDAYRNVAIAINAGNAAEMLAARPGDTVEITVRSRA
jgi:S-adenosylmethionine hydrolase